MTINYEDAALYGLCVECGASRTVTRTVEIQGAMESIILDMVCSADPSHTQDGPIVLP